MTTTQMWRTELGTMLTAEIGRLRLVVKMPRETGGAVRFQVFRHGTAEASGDRPGELIASGVRPDVRAAMTAAEEMAASVARG